MSNGTEVVTVLRYYILLATFLFFCLKSHSQNVRDFKGYLIVFLVSGFNGDSVNIFLNKETIIAVRLKSTIASGRIGGNFAIKLTDSVQRLNIYDVENNNKFEAVIKKDFQYLYIFRLSDNDYEVDYSNRLRLPE